MASDAPAVTRPRAVKQQMNLAGKTRITLLCAVLLFASTGMASDQPHHDVELAPTTLQDADLSRQEALYQQRLLTNPKDAHALARLAALQAHHGDFGGAITSYRRLLQLTPNDHDAKVALGRALASTGQYDAAIRTYQELLRTRSDDTDAQEGMALTQTWSGHPEMAIRIFENLKTLYPADPDYAVGLARAQAALHQYAEARKTLTAFLTAQPGNRDAELALALVDLYDGRQAVAWQRFNRLIRRDPTNTEALLGNVRIAYYRGDLVYARALAARIVDDDSRNVPALLLLADLERALHHRRQAWALVEHVKTLQPANAEARQLEASLRRDAQPAMHTSASYAREISARDPAGVEDLSSFAYESAWSFLALPRSEASLSLDYLPSQSPDGGIRGAVAPSQVYYRQSSYLTPRLTLRGGAGLMRFGPGELAGVPTQAQFIAAAGTRPVGFGSASYVVRKKLTVDFTAGRAAMALTPTAVRLGVVEDRLTLGWDYRFTPRTDIRLEPFTADDASVSYQHVTGIAGSIPEKVNRVDRNRSAGASITFTRNLVERRTLAVDLGYAGLAYEIQGGLNKPYLGFFNPSFYQRQYLTTHLTGTLWRPVGYDFTGGAGVQQIERSTPLKPALLLSPGFKFQISPRLVLTLAYAHYDSAQSLGTLRGNAVRLATDWKF